MVEENEIRAELSPWERGRIACLAVRQRVFPTIEEAVAKLFPMASKDKRSRLRTLARLVEEMDGRINDPERLGLRQALRLANACRVGFGHVIRTALEQSAIEDHAGQWELILPLIVESERQPADDPLPNPHGLFRRPDRPRRVLHLRRDIVIRREQTRDGWCLHFTGKLATSDFCDTVFDEIELKFAPG
jgi:ParB family chromosome partitioning protein